MEIAIKRLKALDVHEVSLVKAAANAKRYLIRKRAPGDPMPTAEYIREQLLSVPEPIVKSIEDIAKAAGEQDGASEDAMAAMKAAARILAPHADSIHKEQVDQLMQAIGMMGASGAQAEADPEDAATESAGDTDNGEDEETDEEPADKAAPPKWLKNKIKRDSKKDAPDVDDDNDEENVDKAGCGPGLGIGTQAPGGATQTIVPGKSAMAKAAQGPVSQDDGLRYDSTAPDSRAPSPLETTVAKSAELDLKGFSEAQRAALEPVLKSQAALAQATNELRAAHKEAVAKSAALQHKLDRKEFVAKAAAFPHLGNADELGAKLHDLHDNHPDGYDGFMDILKTANQAYDNSALFQERGSSLPTTGSAAAQLDGAIDSIVQKSATPISRDAAAAQFFRTPEGRKMYRAERKEAEQAIRRV